MAIRKPNFICTVRNERVNEVKLGTFDEIVLSASNVSFQQVLFWKSKRNNIRLVKTEHEIILETQKDIQILKLIRFIVKKSFFKVFTSVGVYGTLSWLICCPSVRASVETLLSEIQGSKFKSH